MWQITHLETVDSTNDYLKRLAVAGQAGEGAVAVAGEQTGGKGRRGRSFQSLAGKGLYLSVLLRPNAAPETVPQLTAWAAVAVCRAVEALCTLRPTVKWPNDVLVEGKKLCGILTEMTGPWVILGMGVNTRQTAADFGPELADKAVSLAQLGAEVEQAALEKALLEELAVLRADFPQNKTPWLAEYRRRCATLGREVRLVEPEGARTATALDVDEAFALRVRLEDGTERTVTSGEVSVRGLLGYG